MRRNSEFRFDRYASVQKPTGQPMNIAGVGSIASAAPQKVHQ